MFNLKLAIYKQGSGGPVGRIREGTFPQRRENAGNLSPSLQALVLVLKGNLIISPWQPKLCPKDALRWQTLPLKFKVSRCVIKLHIIVLVFML